MAHPTQFRHLDPYRTYLFLTDIDLSFESALSNNDGPTMKKKIAREFIWKTQYQKYLHDIKIQSRWWSGLSVSMPRETTNMGIGGRIMDRRCMEIYLDRLRCVWWPNSKNQNDLSKDRMHTFSEHRETEFWIFGWAWLKIDMISLYHLFLSLIYIFYNSCSFCIKLLIFIP